MTKLLTLDNLFLRAVRVVVVVAKLVILGIPPLILFILAARVVLVVKLVISGILSSIYFLLGLYTSFLTTSFFITSLSLLLQQEQILIYQHLIFPTFNFQIA